MLNAKDDTLDAYVVGNAARPIMSHGLKGTKSTRRSYLYVEAVKKFEEEFKEVDLTEAYKKASPLFVGRLEKTFIVLKDKQGKGIEMIPTGSNKEPLG